MIDEGYIKFVSDWQPGEAPTGEEIDALLAARRPLFEAGLIGYDHDAAVGYGNLSARVDNSSRFVISGTQTGHIEEASHEHFAVVTSYDIDRNKVHCSGPVEASSESMTHAALYEADASIDAVVHVHSIDLWNRWKGVLPTAAATIRYGTPEMAREIQRLYTDTPFAEDGIAVMAGHEGGLIGVGRDPMQAAMRLLCLHERFSKKDC